MYNMSYFDDSENLNNTILNKFGRLAHVHDNRYNGVYVQAKEIYKLSGLAAEGHRNYPLREVKALRRYFELQLPFAPYLENWGRLVASHPGLR